ncbi:MAG: S41 family peptidase [Treponema sp.]|jgi:C-terminal processing protease CtpA/Prc|nr:S41 family peptidase [Treponema sp.]
MRRTKALCAPPAVALITLPFFALLYSCNVFLGPEPDTGPQAVLRGLWNDFNEIHAYIDIRMSYNRKFLSWDDVYEHYNRTLLERIPASGGGMDGKYLFYICCDMLGELADPHVSLFAPGGNFFWSKADDIQKIEESWFILALIKEKYLKDQGINNGSFFTYGRFNEPYGNIGYIHIASFINNEKLEKQDWVREIDGIMDFFQRHGDINAVVIDIRNNSGGSGPVAEYIASRFTSVQKNYMKASAKNGPGRNDFSTPMTFRVRPEGKTFTKRIALLTNKATVSASEWFTMAMRTQGHVTHVGTPTRGAFSPKTSRPMINGWYYTISAFRVTDMAGNCFEGKGISPEPEYIFRGDSNEGAAPGDRKDTQLEKVLAEIWKWLNS